MKCSGVYCKCKECQKLLDWSVYYPQAKANMKLFNSIPKKVKKIKKCE